ncbi:MAG: hypothetical protein HOV87_29065 [Catenulispora sp.]|nr:hypothetical protein [Catenulispora sp.]
MSKLLVFLDVDGVVLPIGRFPEDLTADLGRRLAALPGELVWATAWEHEANTEIAPRIGLPQLPVVEWGGESVVEVLEDDFLGLHWKTRLLVRWADGRDFVWFDDEPTDIDVTWVADNHRGRALVYRVPQPTVGLTDGDFEALERWLTAGAPTGY